VVVDGLGVGTNDDVYTSNALIRRVKRMSSTGTTISHWGPSGTGFAFESAGALAIDSNGDVLVLDAHAIHRFSSTGAWKATYPDGNHFGAPRSIAVAPGGTIYVSIIGSILRFNSTGTYLDEWAVDIGFGASPGLAVGIDAAHDVYVSDPAHDKILRYSSTGTFIDDFGSSGTANGKFDAPYGVAVGPDGDVYVADSGNNRVQRFTADGTFVTKWGSPGFGNGQFTAGPHAIAVGASGDILVGDNQVRIQQFRYPAVAKPDGRVRLGTSGAFIGNDVYNTTGANQTATGSAKPGKTVTFNLSVQNDGGKADRFKLKGVGSTAKYSIVYKNGATNITAAVKAGTYRTTSLAPGAARVISVVVSVKSGAAVGSKLSTLITITSVADAARKDAVKLVAKRK
jgi:hypothetical protein